jgi:UDP-N-acetylmuramoyl-L-alanyl-D-glutamate--2,6-diaminopimelate ligase
LISTVAYEVGARSIPAARTTPDAATTQDLLRQMVDVGCSAAVMEVSSHALIQKRTVGVDFDVAIFTNLTRDHLDYHKTMDAYYEAKAILFRTLADTATAVINVDDVYGQRLQSESLPCNVLTYSMDNASADVRADDVHVSIEGCRFVAKTPWGDHAVQLKLLGRHNVSNALACIAACGILGASTEAVAKALSQRETVRGRLEPVAGEQRFSVFVDYAHTDDALAHALRTVRELTTGRVIVVFGCGGNRDKTKRPVMGKVAAELADVVVVTSDNPRNEAPEVIIEEILSGVTETSATIKSVEDRAEAIRLAIGMAEAGDVVLIAGKGHETHQECGSRSLSFDDHEVAQEALQAMQSGVCKSGRGND